MKTIAGIVVAIIVVVVAYSFLHKGTGPQAADVQTGPPPVLQVVYLNSSMDNIVVDAPLPGATVSRTFDISGKARGGWYFEASFPVHVFDQNKQTIFEGPIQAHGDWMTPEYVPFSTTITIPGSYTGPATLVLNNDNPSGLPENDKSISIPIVIR